MMTRVLSAAGLSAVARRAEADPAALQPASRPAARRIATLGRTMESHIAGVSGSNPGALRERRDYTVFHSAVAFRTHDPVIPIAIL
jgi:hypothetical protein